MRYGIYAKNLLKIFTTICSLAEHKKQTNLDNFGNYNFIVMNLILIITG